MTDSKPSRLELNGFCKELGIEAELDGAQSLPHYINELEKIVLHLLEQEARRRRKDS